MTTEYDAEHIASFYDEYAEREWARFDDAPGGAASLEIHRRFLADHIRPGWRVLDVGAGPGRFTIELARLGTTVVTADISERQLAMNAERVAEAGVEACVEARVRADIVDLALFDTDSFDAVVCFGGPLSYVLDRADAAMRELVRVTKPGGLVLVSVMSLLGAARAHLDGVVDLAQRWGVAAALDEVMETGVVSAEMNRGHQLKMYRWVELEALLHRSGCHIVAASAANHLTVRGDELVDDLDEDLRRSLLEWEIRTAREPAILDAGTHILAAGRVPTGAPVHGAGLDGS